MRVVCIFAGVAAASTVTPTQKVVQLLEGMMAKATEEKKEEEVKFSKFSQWCDDTDASKSKAIAEEKRMIEQLTAEIAKLSADVSHLTNEIAGLDNDVTVAKTDIKAATEVRGQERSDYAATHRDYSESLDAMDRAIAVLNKNSADSKQTEESLLQLSSVASNVMPARARRALTVFIQSLAADQDVGIHNQAPEAKGYEFQGGGIVQMLEDLKNSFRKDISELEKAELNQKHDYEMMVQTLNDEIEGATKNRNRKAQKKAKKQKRIAEAEGEKDAEESDLAADTQYVEDLRTECKIKHVDYESRNKLRGDEIEAIGKAIDILSSDDVAGAASRNLPGLVQSGHSLLQLRSVARSPSQDHAAAYLQEMALRLDSKVLTEAAQRTDADPFKKVKKMIKNMIIKLKEEANEEAEHTGWCNTELTTNQQTRDRKTAQAEDLQSNIQELEASNAKLSMEIEELSAEVAQLKASMAKATEDRAAEKAKNKQTVSEAQAAQVAVANALSVLEEFYSKAAGATALSQGAPEDAPETFSEPYKGQQGENGGVIGMLEVIQSDFARLEADTGASEHESKESYDKFMSDSETDEAVKSTEIKAKQDKITRQAEELSQATESLHETENELNAAHDYYEKLKPSCVGGGVNYDDRVKQRAEEIQSLKEALRMLNGDDIPMPIESGRAEYSTGASHQGE
mmetsp:Transcript_42070/g.91666  ORF Transcript_42070/g.91666 Transcript_42070/m.91666 type:complete len:685 (+) Transcript_42070:73-2127(+)|eukprot:CAMPEP_0204271928 /NCGR_PEP_ID=MMETSP0468-20130131/21518_1 /ASSEMBLY_ACC=CAM_ASM_000383 /TAXON_ID=2969 /ORGANISM="Oxyrrhis marina" /LENGTH=684 /DNA_ID=CAMNT_0051247707 /DNA_START=41 /DNA_END=2095 /DNA_ORIENTATION=-